MLVVLFKLAGIAALGWFLMIFLPGWSFTKRLANSAALPALVSVLYVFGLGTVLSQTGFGILMDLGTSDGVIRLLAQPSAALLAWIHFIAFDLIVGILIYRDNLRHRVVPVPVQSVLLFLTLMFGPVGFLAYWSTKALRLKRLGIQDEQQASL